MKIDDWMKRVSIKNSSRCRPIASSPPRCDDIMVGRRKPASCGVFSCSGLLQHRSSAEYSCRDRARFAISLEQQRRACTASATLAHRSSGAGEKQSARELADASGRSIRLKERWAPTYLAQVRKNTNQSTPRINTARPVETVNSASTDGPVSACRTSVGVSTI